MLILRLGSATGNPWRTRPACPSGLIRAAEPNIIFQHRFHTQNETFFPPIRSQLSSICYTLINALVKIKKYWVNVKYYYWFHIWASLLANCEEHTEWKSIRVAEPNAIVFQIFTSVDYILELSFLYNARLKQTRELKWMYCCSDTRFLQRVECRSCFGGRSCCT